MAVARHVKCQTMSSKNLLQFVQRRHRYLSYAPPQLRPTFSRTRLDDSGDSLVDERADASSLFIESPCSLNSCIGDGEDSFAPTHGGEGGRVCLLPPALSSVFVVEVRTPGISLRRPASSGVPHCFKAKTVSLALSILMSVCLAIS